MECTNKLSWIIIAKDKSKSFLQQNLILLEDGNFINTNLSYGDCIEKALESLSSRYLKYDPKFVTKELVDIISINKDSVGLEIIYLSVVNYIPSLNNYGTFYSIEELERREIKIDERYGKHLRRKCASMW